MYSALTKETTLVMKTLNNKKITKSYNVQNFQCKSSEFITSMKVFNGFKEFALEFGAGTKYKIFWLHFAG